MENFIVSARKYRPASFDTVVGQGSITATLKNAIKNQQLAQAYLFCGPRGVGKTTCSRIFAKTINCLNPGPDMEACNECESCRAFNENRSYNIHELDAASNNSVDDIRQLIDKVRIPPQIGKYSVYIVDEVHMLSTAAFNAFLKTLEEPPAHAKFILATTEKHKILPTILSRCQIFDFNRMKVEDIVAHLQNLAEKEGVDADVNGLNVIAQKADGGMRDALSFFDQIVSFSGKKFTYQDVINNLNVLDYEYYFKLIDYFREGNVNSSLLAFNEILNKGFDAHHFVSGLSQHIRDIMVCRDESTIQLLEVGADIRDRYKKQAKEVTLPFLYTALNITNKCDLDYRESKSKRLLVELMLMQLCNIGGKITAQAPAQQPQVAIPQTQAQNQQPQPQNQQPQASAPAQPQQQPASQPVQQQASAPESAAKSNNVADPKTAASSVSVSQAPVNQAADPAKKVAANSVSIQAYLQRKNDLAKQEEERQKQSGAATAITVVNECQDFTREQVATLWAKLAEIYRTKKPRLHAIFSQSVPEIKDNYVLEMSLQNSMQNDAINEVKAGFVNYVRQQLHNGKIEVVTKVAESGNSVFVYTDSDKYKYLAQQNENLDVLKKDLNLEF
ncbi:MAG: DNA polymerase III subunit gamma/tau [Bacteroidales bacterium]|nr:DNA polymerase III subunit gamma/tau [Bacteroidales bacterium]